MKSAGDSLRIVAKLAGMFAGQPGAFDGLGGREERRPVAEFLTAIKPEVGRVNPWAL